MFFWFTGMAFVLVWAIFKDTAVDYRLVMGGALLPDLVDVVAGGPRLLHTLLASVVLLTAVMLGTRGRRQLRRRLLALPIGTFCHLLLDATWGRTATFWWPAFGFRFQGSGLPSLQRPWGLLVLQELAGLAALLWCWHRFRLAEAPRRSQFVRTGRLGRDLLDRGGAA
ncbi:MAG: hypothetical protein M3P34_03750 [Actinomycetota bacterium]|nr:hypothetical protein [Actinomycetota bacterium]